MRIAFAGVRATVTGCVECVMVVHLLVQDDTYTESYISTIGVDFVRIILFFFLWCCVSMYVPHI